MSKKTISKLINTNKIIRHPILEVHHKNINESIKTSSYHYKTYNLSKKPIILNFIKNNAISKAIQKKNGFNQTSKSTFVEENLIINQTRKTNNLNKMIFDNNYIFNKENKAVLFNNSLLNQKYYRIRHNQFSNLTKVKDQYLKLNNIYNPHKNYSEVVNDRKHILKAFLSQTKNNFNNNYYLIYSDPDKHKRNYISKCFESIKNINKKNVDKGNSIESLAEKEIYSKSKAKMFDSSKRFNKKNNINITIPSSFDINIFVPKSQKFKIQTLNYADDIMREYSDPFKVKKKRRLVQSALFKKGVGGKTNIFINRKSMKNEN